MRHYILFIVLFVFGCSPLHNLEKLPTTNSLFTVQAKDSPAKIHFPNINPVGKPYIEGPILTSKFANEELENWSKHLSKIASQKGFDAAIIISQTSGSYIESLQNTGPGAYLLVTYMGIWYATEETFSTNQIRQIKYFSHTLKDKEEVATAHFDVRGKIKEIKGDRENFEWFQSWQPWYYGGSTHDEWYRSKSYSKNYSVDMSNPETPVLYNRHYELIIAGEFRKNILVMTSKTRKPLGYIAPYSLADKTLALYFREGKSVFRCEYEQDDLGRISKQKIFLVAQSEVLIASAEYEYHRLEDLIVYPAKAKF